MAGNHQSFWNHDGKVMFSFVFDYCCVSSVFALKRENLTNTGHCSKNIRHCTIGPHFPAVDYNPKCIYMTIKATKHLRTSCAVLSLVITAINSTCTCNYQTKSQTWAKNCKMCPKKLKLPQNCPELDFTWDWQSSEWEVARGHAAVGEDCGVDPTKERRHSRVHIREAL